MLLAEESFEESALMLVEKFLNRINEDTPWKYSEEKSFFFAPILSAVLMMQADIMKEDGMWTGQEPTQSLLGKLLYSKRELFFFPDSERQLIFAKKENSSEGIVILFYKRKRIKEFSSFEASPLSKCIIFTITNYTKKGGIDPRIDLNNSFIDGQNLPSLLGFRTMTKKIKSAGNIREKEIPYFPEESLKKLL